MIHTNDLTEEHIGNWVIYKSSNGDIAEKGRIKSWNDKFIFVVYRCNNDWNNFKNYTGAATCPEDLEWIKSNLEERDKDETT